MSTVKTPYPNALEKILLDGLIKLLKENNVKLTKQNFGRGTKIFVNQNNTKISFHIYNVSDGGRGWNYMLVPHCL